MKNLSMLVLDSWMVLGSMWQEWEGIDKMQELCGWMMWWDTVAKLCLYFSFSAQPVEVYSQTEPCLQLFLF